LFHTHTPKAIIVGMLAAKFAGVPNRLHTVAGLLLMEATGNKRKLLDCVERLTYRCATNVYLNSKGLYDFILKNNFICREKLKVIANGSSNGINTSHFEIELFSANDKQMLKINLGITLEDFVFILIGHLVIDKGINELIQAFQKIAEEKNGVKLLLVGAFEPDLELFETDTLNEITANSKIISVGFQKEGRPYFAVGGFLAFPNY
jgi:glycosyltransferase involved in cell wall biosynthesis